MKIFIKLVCLSIAAIAPAHAMQNDADLGMRLLAAARLGDHKELERLIAAGAQANHTIKGCNWTALMCAAEHGHLLCVKAIINAKAQVNYVNRDGDTALIVALRGNLACVKALIAAGARVKHTDNNDITILSWAAVHGQPFCELLVDAMLKIPNQAQKVRIVTLLGIDKFGKKCSGLNDFDSLPWHRLDANARGMLKTAWLETVYEENKNNFKNSIAYQEINKIRDPAMIQALLEKYNPSATTQSSCSIQ